MYVNENFFETSTGFTVSLADSMHFKQIMQHRLRGGTPNSSLHVGTEAIPAYLVNYYGAAPTTHGAG
jgi:hypothetical protein